MKIYDMFQKDIDRQINGVIKVMQTDDENRRQELEEYVITRELRKHFGSFYDHYEQSVDGATDQMGVWISGFFGSGKSHFLKILSYLLANEEIGGKRAIDYFEDKFSFDPLRYAMMRRVSEVPTETILFNIDAKSPMGKDQDAILRVFTKVFYEHCGYYGDDMKVAALERFLDRQGRLEAFKAAFEAVNTEPWATAREAFAFWEDDVVAALTQTAGMSENAARNWFNGEETAEMSIERLGREIAEYVDGKAPNFHLVFLVDEIGQYIGDNSGMMLNLQTLVEELGSRCKGKVWVIVTSQEDIDAVTHVKGNDFSKIQGRFNTRLSLSSASVDEVIKRRILAKNDAAAELLRMTYHQNASVMRNLFSFAKDTPADMKGYGAEEEFVEAYPFVPYQFRLLQDVLVQVRKSGSSGKHLSGGERSMLSAFQEAAQSMQGCDERAFVPFYRFYDTVHTFLDGAVRRVIDRAERDAATGDGLKRGDVDILKLLFLIRYVDGMAGNLENLCTLMISDVHDDKITMRRDIQQALDRLVHENYVSRNGEIYLFLTDEEQEINNDIRRTLVDPTEIIGKIGETVFGDLYPGKKYRYKNRYDFTYDQMVDNGIRGQQIGGIRLRIVTAESDLAESGDSSLRLQSRANSEAIVLLDGNGYYNEIAEALRIAKYVKSRNVSQLPEAIRKIIQARQSEARERERTAATLLREAIVKGAFYIAGERMNIRAQNVKDALDQAMGYLIEDVYSKLNFVTAFAQGDEDIRRILTGENQQETMLGVDAPNAQALDEIRQFMEVRERQHIAVTVGEIQRRYQAAPYGWREIDVAALIAALMRAQKLQLIRDNLAIPYAERRAVDCLRRRADMDKTIVRLRVTPSDALMKKARAQAVELFDTMDIKQDEENLCGQIVSLLSERKRQCGALLAQYQGATPYPGKAVVEQGMTLIGGILDRRGDNVAMLEAFTRAEDELLDWKEDFAEVDFFFKNQAGVFRDAVRLSEQAERDSHYFADEPQAVEAAKAIRAIIQMQRPYREVRRLPELKAAVQQAYARISDARRARVEETVVQARGDVHTLAGDEPELRGDIRKIDEQLEAFKARALEAESPVELDAIITQIFTYRDGQCRRLEQLLAGLHGQNAPSLRVKTIRRYDVLPQKRLSSAAEIEAYVEQLKQKLLQELAENDAIQLN